MTQSTQDSWRNQSSSSSDQSSECERSPSQTRRLSLSCKDAKLKAKNNLSSNSESIITMDMLSIYEKLTPTFDSSEKRRLFLIRLQHIFDLEFPDQEINSELFGSSTNSLGSNHSDVDVCILTPGEVFKNIRTLANCLKKYGFTNIICIPEAKIPIVKAYDTLLDLFCDFNVNNPVALSNTKLIRTYVDIDPRVRPLTMMIKYWTSRRKLNDAAAGGTLSTYTWVNIVINFLQMRNPPILPVLHQIPCAPSHTHGVNVAFFDDVSLLAGFGRANKETLGGLLFAFFKHFGYEFDFNENVVSVRHGKYLSKKEKGWHTGKLYRMFCVEEPFTTIRNLGNSADLISVIGIRDELRRAARILLEKASFSMVCQTYRPIYSNSDGSETEDPNTGETSFFQWDDEIVEELTYLTSQLALDHPHYLHPPKYDPKRRINLPKSAPLPNIPNLYSSAPEPKPAAPLPTKLKDPSPRSNNRSKSDQKTNHDTSGSKPKNEPNGKDNSRRSNSSNSRNSRNRSRGRGEKSGNRGSKNSNNSNANSGSNPSNNSSSQPSKSSKGRKKSSNRNSSRANGKANPTAAATAS